ncbi:HET domain-containing protein [Microdochium nivale]|nr:HET domain-containing protein [Microdochium nivale]
MPSRYKCSSPRKFHSLRSIAIEYIALSYTWDKHSGTADHQPLLHNIHLDGHVLHVQENLWDFIASRSGKRLLRQHTLWFIDAICIDQSSNTEKLAQLQLMPEIFAKATKTIVWLGKDNHSHANRVAHLVQRVFYRFFRSCSSHWRPSVLQRLVRSRYWTRLFVVPELILAGNITLCIDDVTVAWPAFERLVCSARKAPHMIPRGFYRNMLRILETKRSWDSRRRAGVHNFHHQLEAQGLLLCDAMQMFSQLDCKDDRDRVYALLPLVRECPIRVDYRPSHTKLSLFRDVVRHGLAELHADGRPEGTVRDAAAFLYRSWGPRLSGEGQAQAAEFVRGTLMALYPRRVDTA